MHKITKPFTSEPPIRIIRGVSPVAIESAFNVYCHVMTYEDLIYRAKDKSHEADVVM